MKKTQDSNLSLTCDDGEYLFSHLFLLCPNTFGTKGLERTDVLEFVEAGGNVVLFAASRYEESISKVILCLLVYPIILVIDWLNM